MAKTEGILDCNTSFGFFPGREVDISLGKLLDIMRANHVEKALSLSTRGLFHDYRRGNDETVEISRRHPQIIPVASLDPRRSVDFTEEIRRRVDQGVNVFRFFPDHQGWPIRFLPFVRCLEQLSAQGAVAILPFTGVGACTDILEVAGDLKLPMILTSVGYGSLAEVIVAMQSKRDLYVESRLLSAPDCFGALRQEIGLDRVVFGSGAPLEYLESALRVVTGSDMTEDEQRAVLGGNLRRLLGG